MPELTEEEYRQFRELLEKEAIRDVNMRNSRAVDRLDEEALRSVYWPDGYDSASFFEGTADEYLQWVVPFLRKNRVLTHHSVCQMKIDLEGDHAYSESYFIAHSYGADENGELRGGVTVGRYLDHYEKRDGEWRFKHRRRAYDWNMDGPYTSPWEQAPLKEVVQRGEQGPGDPVYHMRNLLK